MSVGITAKVTGDKEVMRKIKVLAEKNVDALKGVMNKSVLVVERRAKQKVPVLTGRLRSSITHEVEKTRNGYGGRVGTDVGYAANVEFGGQPSLIEYKGLLLKKSGSAKPYLFPALKNSEKDIIRFLSAAIKAIRI